MLFWIRQLWDTCAQKELKTNPIDTLLPMQQQGHANTSVKIHDKHTCIVFDCYRTISIHDLV